MEDKNTTSDTVENSETPETEADPTAVENEQATVESEPSEGEESTAEPELTPEQERDDFRDKYMRALADLENLRRRHQKERQDLIRYAAERPLGEMFPIFDNLQRAVEHADADPDTIVQGVNMILSMADQALQRMSVQSVGTIGESFDPNLHDALQQMPSDEIEKGKVMAMFERGYKLHDRLLRPAKVVVSTGPAAAQEDDTADSDSGDLASAAADLEGWEPSNDE